MLFNNFMITNKTFTKSYAKHLLFKLVVHVRY